MTTTGTGTRRTSFHSQTGLLRGSVCNAWLPRLLLAKPQGLSGDGPDGDLHDAGLPRFVEVLWNAEPVDSYGLGYRRICLKNDQACNAPSFECDELGL